MKKAKAEAERCPSSKLFVIRDEILKVIDSEDLREDLNREIAKIIAPFDDGKIAISLKREIIELISSIEMIKIRFLRGEVRAKDLHREVRLQSSPIPHAISKLQLSG